MEKKKLLAGTLSMKKDSDGYQYIFYPKCDIYSPETKIKDWSWNLGDVHPSIVGDSFILRGTDYERVMDMLKPKTPEDFINLLDLASPFEGKDTLLERISNNSCLALHSGYLKESIINLIGTAPITLYESASILTSFKSTGNYKKL
jgi:hypothetical protein